MANEGTAAAKQRIDEAFASRQSDRMMEMDGLLEKAERQARGGMASASVASIVEARAVLRAMAQTHERSVCGGQR